MKNLKNAIFGLAALLLTSAVCLTPMAAAVTPANVTLSLSPSSSTSLTSGGNLTVGVYEDSGSSTINAVQINMSYPASALTFNSASYDNTAFDLGPQGNEGSGGAGTVKLTRLFSVQPNGCTSGCTYGVTGKQLVATLYFSVTATSGTINITFDNTSSAASPPDGTKANVTSQNGTYSFPGSTPTQPPSGSGGGGTSGGGSSSGSTSTTTKTKTTTTTPVASAKTNTYKSASGQLTISNISAENISGDSASITWTTSAPASSEVDYGLAADQLYLTATNSTASTTHSLSLDSKNLKPNQTYYFVVKSTDSSGNAATSQVLSFQTSASSPSASSAKSSSKTAVIAGVAVIVLLVLLAVVFMSKMHKKSASLDELASHIATPPPAAPTASINGNAVITPAKEKPADKNQPKPPTGIQVG